MKNWSLLAAFAAPSALAHHGGSEYDAQRPLTLAGTIEEAGYSIALPTRIHQENQRPASI